MKLAGFRVPSIVHPGELFAVHSGLMVRSAGRLNPADITRVLSVVFAVLQPPRPRGGVIGVVFSRPQRCSLPE